MPTEFRVVDEKAPRNLRQAPRLEGQIATVLRDFTSESARRFTSYPPKRGGSRYRRTGDLARSWSRTVGREGSNIVGRLSSNPAVAPHNVKVQGPRRGSSRKRSQVAFLRARGWQPVPDNMVGLWRRKYRGRVRNVIQLRR